MSRIKNAVKNRQDDSALIQSQIGTLEQKAKFLQAENQRTQLHIGLTEIINKFNKNALNYRKVTIAIFFEKLESCYGANNPVLEDLKNSDIYRVAAENKNGETSQGEEAESFAVDAVTRELVARGNSIENIGSDPELALLVVHRLIEYKKAWLRRHILFLKKECPDVEHPDSEMRDAAFAGFLLAKGEHDNPEAIRWLNKITQLENSVRSVPHFFSDQKKREIKNLSNCFRSALSGQNKAKWKQPALDAWLLLIWPLVKAEKWNYATVYYLAEIKFPGFNGKPMRSADAMSRHCKLTLGLRINESKGGRPKNSGFGLGLKLSLLHRFAMTIGDSFPNFSSFQKFPCNTNQVVTTKADAGKQFTIQPPSEYRKMKTPKISESEVAKEFLIMFLFLDFGCR